MYDIIYNIFQSSGPLMVIVSVIAISFRLVNIIENKRKYNIKMIFNDIVFLLFINYILALFYIISFQDVSFSTYNVTPFREIFRYKLGSQLFFKNIIGNMIMFIPFGLSIPIILKTYKIRSVIFLSFIASLTIEITQLSLGRVFDIDDILLNILGALLGLLIYKIFIYISNILKGGKYEQNRNIQSNK